MDKICGNCQHYTMHQTNGPWCMLKRREVSYLQRAFDECFEEPGDAPKNLGMTKVCSRCGRELPIANFGRHSRTKDGYQPCCRECQSKMNKGHKKRKPFERNEAPAKPEEPEPIPEGMKRCSHCGRILPVTEFRKHKNHPDGLQYACKECQVEMTTKAKQKRTAKRNEVIREAQKEVIKEKILAGDPEMVELPATSGGLLEKEVENIPVSRLIALECASDETIVEELRRRGYQGNLIKKVSFIL